MPQTGAAATKEAAESAAASGGGATVLTTALTSLRGEAYIETDRRKGRATRAYDLSFAVEWRATIGGATHAGSITFSDFQADSALDEVEVEARFGEEKAAAVQATLVALLGPLKPRAALEAGRLTQRLWQGLHTFREDFAALPAEEVPE